jgi:hypothetical protein
MKSIDCIKLVQDRLNVKFCNCGREFSCFTTTNNCGTAKKILYTVYQGFSTGVPRNHRVPRDVAKGSARGLLG